MKMKGNKYIDNKIKFSIVIGKKYSFVEFYNHLFIFEYTCFWKSKIDRSFIKLLQKLEKEVLKDENNKA
jgi:hypothetical protein